MYVVLNKLKNIKFAANNANTRSVGFNINRFLCSHHHIPLVVSRSCSLIHYNDAEMPRKALSVDGLKYFNTSTFPCNSHCIEDIERIHKAVPATVVYSLSSLTRILLSGIVF